MTEAPGRVNRRPAPAAEPGPGGSGPERGDRLGRRAAFVAAAACFAVAGGAAACSVAPPAFNAVSARLVVHATDAEGGADERLSVFASVTDQDGIDDIEFLYVIHDGEELCWTLTKEDWQRSDEGSSVWIGGASLDAPGTALPRGQYRLVMVDKAGERGERSFALSAPPTEGYSPPKARLSGNSVSVDSSYQTNTAFFLDSGGNVTHTVPVTAGLTQLDALWPGGQWRSGADFIAVYGLDPKAETGFFSWKIRLPD